MKIDEAKNRCARCGGPVPGPNAKFCRRSCYGAALRGTKRDPAHVHRTHGLTRTPGYKAWQAMRIRCSDPAHPYFDDYGGRGITVCSRWRDDFAAFIADVGLPPSKKHQIDRYPDNDGNYEPGNVRWATSSENNRNRRSNVWLDAFGERRIQLEWCERFGISEDTFRWRHHRLGWSVERALTTPVAVRGAGARKRRIEAENAELRAKAGA